MNLLLHIHKNQDWLLTAVEAALGEPGGLLFFYLSVYARVYTQETIPGQNARSTILHSCTTAFQCHVLLLCPVGRYTFALL